MSVSLLKGQKMNLTKENPKLKKILVGLGWDVNQKEGGEPFDLDAEAFMTCATGECPTENEFVFYGNLEHLTGAVKHMGDNNTGQGDGDDEQIFVDLEKVPEGITMIAFTVTIYDGEKNGQNFSQISNAYIRVVNQETCEEIARFDLSEQFSTETAVVVGGLYNNCNEWSFNAIGMGFQGGLAELCEHYGIDTE